ncbi:MAG: beta galactosidase jelly roll domain-containing protein [Candidatus Sericytochromatia bacterium]|nr:beta galactosidase jelly roll domain-containing protein [Candidatus Tanganyikabacteria bacterium]
MRPARYGCAAVLLATVASLALSPAAAQDLPIIEEVVPPPELGRGSPVDIARMTWRVAAGDAAAMARPEFDDSSWVARGGVSQELLRNPVAWYRFAFLVAPGTEALGSQLELGGVEGNVSVYLNGTLIGEMRGETLPPYERRETFTLPAALLSPERNVLALRLAGFAGRAKVGILRGPVRLMPLSRSYEREASALRALREADQAAARLGGIAARLEEFGYQAQLARVLLASGAPQSQVDAAFSALEAARKASSAALAATPQATGSSGLPFGRFGRAHQEGLLTASLWPGGFRGASTGADPEPVGGEFGRPAPGGDHVALEAISPEGKVVRVRQARGDRYRLFYPLMYPGFAVEPLDVTLSIRFDRPLDALWVDRWGIATASAATPGRLPWTEPWVLLHDPAGARPPILVGLGSPRQALRLAPSGGGFTLEIPAGQIARFCWPTGIAPWQGPPDGATMKRFRAWADAMVPFTRTAEESARGDRLAVRERFGYLPTGHIPYAPLPPVYGAVLAGGGPVVAPRARDLGIPTLAGPLRGDRKAAELAYELPLPDTGHRVVPRVEGAALDASPGPLPDPQAGNAQDLAHTRRAEALARWPILARGARQALESSGQAQLARAWGPLAWAETLEPLTGTPYRWTLATIAGDGRIRGVTRPNGLALFGTSLAAAFPGDWSVPAVQWLRIKRAFEWFGMAKDWAWQAPVDSDAGQAAGDALDIEGAYLGAIGFARLAEGVSPDDAAAGVAMAARLGPLVNGRDLVAQHLAATGLLPPGLSFAGFTETGVAAASPSAAAPPATASAPVPDPPPATLASWSPARLEDLVWKPRTRTLEVKLAIKQATDRLVVRIDCPKPADVQINGQPGDVRYDLRSGSLVYAPERAAGPQTLVVRF